MEVVRVGVVDKEQTADQVHECYVLRQPSVSSCSSYAMPALPGQQVFRVVYTYATQMGSCRSCSAPGIAAASHLASPVELNREAASRRRRRLFACGLRRRRRRWPGDRTISSYTTPTLINLDSISIYRYTVQLEGVVGLSEVSQREIQQERRTYVGRRNLHHSC